MTTIPWSQLIEEAESGGGFEVLPVGLYSAVVEKAEAKPTSTGKQMIATTFKIESGPYAGRKVFNNFVLVVDNPNALGFFFKHMAALGADKAFFAMQPSLEAVATHIVGARCTIQVEQRPWNNELRNDVKNVTPPGDTAPTPPTPAPAPAPTQVAPPAEQPPAAAEPAPQAPPAAAAAAPGRPPF